MVVGEEVAEVAAVAPLHQSVYQPLIIKEVSTTAQPIMVPSGSVPAFLDLLSHLRLFIEYVFPMSKLLWSQVQAFAFAHLYSEQHSHFLSPLKQQHLAKYHFHPAGPLLARSPTAESANTIQDNSSFTECNGLDSFTELVRIGASKSVLIAIT